MLAEVLIVVDRFVKPLQDCSSNLNAYKALLDELDPIVRRSAQDEKYRQTLASSEELWEKLKTALQNVKNVSGKEAIRSIYLRCVRALLLLMRNLSVSNQNIARRMLLQFAVVKAFIKAINGNYCYDEMETSLYVAATSFLYNLTKESVLFDDANIGSVDLFLRYPINHSDKSAPLLLPCSLLFLNLTMSDDYLYHFLKQQGQDDIMYHFFVSEIVEHHTALFNHLDRNPTEDAKYKLGTMDAVILKIFSNAVTCESFAPYLQNAKKDDSEKFLKILKLAQLVVTSTENWDKFQLTNIMSWCFPIMQNTAEAVNEYFRNHHEEVKMARDLHADLNISLDIISSLCKYEHVHQYLLSYDGLETLVSLLKILEDNLIRINFYKSTNGSIKSIKATNSKGEKIIDQQILSQRIDLTNYQILSTNFPQSKSFIVEIIASLTYHNPIVQNKMRSLGGLGLVLSNCIIDENDPFIKERSIICIKFLLKNNKENQDYVASLEAKKAVQDEILAEAGYEIQIGENGKVNLAPKKSI